MRNGKKIMSLLMVIILVGLFPLSALAEELDDSTILNEVIELDEGLVRDESAELDEVSDAYRFGDYALQDIDGGVIITAYHGYGGDISLSDATPKNGIINVGYQAFMDSNVVTGVTFNRTVEINNYAFMRAIRLEKVVFDGNIRDIGAYAFAGCTALKKIRIPSCVEYIGANAFDGCDLTIYGVAGSYADRYANAYEIPFVPDKVVPAVKCQYRTHVQNIGWQRIFEDGATSGTSGKGLRLEAIQIAVEKQGSDLGVAYRTHVQNRGWEQKWNYDKDVSGTSGTGLRLEAIQIYLTGYDSNNYDIYYRVHAQNFGWLDWAKDGAFAGTAGYGNRLEAIQIIVVPVGSPAPGPTTRPYYKIGGGVG